MKKSISAVILVAFFFSTIKSPAYAQLDPMPFMPNPGVMVHLSPEFSPAYLKGIIIHPENPLKFDFIVYKGDKDLNDVQKREEYTKLTKYFLASLAIPDDDQWVNLSPYEKDRIIKNDFGKTEMGRDLLAQDYMLKQITASLIYPEDNLGRKFWDKVYSQAQEKFGTSNIPVNTFNKVWILPDDAEIYEKGNTAFVFKSHLKVMLEEDYLSLQKHAGIQSVPMDNKTHTIASKIVKEIILPELENEVNEGKNFASLRQVFSGMILAAWYKRALKESFLSQIYANKSMVKGVDQDPRTNALIFQEYLKAYKKGVFNFIKEDVDKYTNETIPRKYFSGGVGVDAAVLTRAIKRFPANNLMAEQATTREVLGQGEKYDITVVLADEINDAAMMVAPQKLLQDQSVKTVAGNDKEVEIFYNTNALRLGSKSGKALYDFNTNFNNSTRAFVVWGQFVLIMDAHSFRVIYLKTKTSHLDVPLDSFFLGLGVKNINQSFEDRGFLLSNDRKTVIGVRNMTLFPVGKLLMLESANNGIKSFQLNKSNLKYLKTLFLFGNDRAMVNTSPRVLEPGRPQSIVAVNGQEVPIRYYTFKAADAKEEDKDVLQIGQEIAIPLMSKHDTKNRQVIISGHYVFLLDGQMFSIYKLLNEKDYFEIPKEAYLQFFTNFRNPQAVLKKRGFLISDKIIQLLGVGGVKLDAQNKKIILNSTEGKSKQLIFPLSELNHFLDTQIKDRAMTSHAFQELKDGQSIQILAANNNRINISYTKNSLVLTYTEGKKIIPFSADFEPSTRSVAVYGHYIFMIENHHLKVLYLEGKSFVSPILVNTFLESFGELNKIKAEFTHHGFIVPQNGLYIHGVESFKVSDNNTLILYSMNKNAKKMSERGSINLPLDDPMKNLDEQLMIHRAKRKLLAIELPQRGNVKTKSASGEDVLISYSDDFKDLLNIGSKTYTFTAGFAPFSRKTFIYGSYIFLQDANKFSVLKIERNNLFSFVPIHVFLSLFGKPENIINELQKKGFSFTDNNMYIDLRAGYVSMGGSMKSIVLNSSLATSRTKIFMSFPLDHISRLNGALRKVIKDKAIVTITKAEHTYNGGIDLNAAYLNLKIKRDGQGVPLPLAQQDMAQLSQLEGLLPVLLSIKPATDSPVFSELISTP